MLVYYFGHVAGSLEKVARAITAAEGDLSAWARVAHRKGEELRTRIDPSPFLPAKEVGIELGDPVGRSGSVIIPLQWRATGVGSLFPTMNADLVLQPIGSDVVQVVFRGSYDPPLGGLGRILDRAVLHRLAEASAKTFLDQLCIAIEETLSSDREQYSDSGPPSWATVDGRIATGLLGSAAQA